MEDVLYVADLIQLHRIPFFIKSEEDKEKLIRKVGANEFGDIMILHESDINAE